MSFTINLKSLRTQIRLMLKREKTLKPLKSLEFYQMNLVRTMKTLYTTLKELNFELAKRSTPTMVIKSNQRRTCNLRKIGSSKLNNPLFKRKSKLCMRLLSIKLKSQLPRQIHKMSKLIKIQGK